MDPTVKAELMREYFEHGKIMQDHAMELLKSQHQEVVDQTAEIIKLFTIGAKEGKVPPDSVTVAALRAIADSIEFASQQMGHDPKACMMFREMHRNAEKSTPGGSAWGD